MDATMDSASGSADVGKSGMDRRDFVRRGAAAAFGAGALLSAAPGALARGAGSTRVASGTTLSFLLWNPLNTGVGLAHTQIAKAYKKLHPNVSVKFEVVPYSTYLATEVTRAKAHRLSDICQQSGLTFSSVFPAMQPLQKTSIKGGAKLNNWGGAVESLAAAPNHGPYAAVPVSSVGTIFYYHKGNFAKAGLDPEKPPRTWGDFMTACAKLRAAGIDPIGISGSDSYTPWWMWTCLVMQFFPSAVQAHKVGTGEVKLTDNRFLRSLQAVQQTYKLGYWNSDYASKKFSDIEADFIAGKLGMVAGITADIVCWSVWDAKIGTDSYGVFSGPLLPGSKTQACFQFPGFLLSTPKNGKHLSQALEYLGFVVSKTGEEILLRTAGFLPNRLDVDVLGITRSKGAAAIRKLYATQPTCNSPLSYMNGAAYGLTLQNLTTTLTSGNLSDFLNSIAQAQAHG